MQIRELTLGLVVSFVVLTAGCTSIGAFEGLWSGQVTQEESVRKGLDEATELSLQITKISRRALEAEVTTCIRVDSDNCTPSRFQQTTLMAVEKARNDELRNMSYGGEPYAVYLMTAQPVDPAEGAVLFFVSLHSQDRVEVRLVRGNDLYAVFRLRRKKE